MARLLYIFPHPDDESFGPGPGMARQRREGHEVYLLTLTRGEATSQRETYGYSKPEMADVRTQEMEAVARTLDLTDLTILDYADGELAEVNPLDLEAAVQQHIEQVRPHVVVTYAVHGISGHPDHLVTHAIVKRVYCALKQNGVDYLQRLALFTLSESRSVPRPDHLRASPDEAIDCILSFTEADHERAAAALACYETYQEVVRKQDPLSTVASGIPYEFYQETLRPQATDLCEGLAENAA
jgi:LmbE family N-acetylglucosaminyl deacetylase